MVIFQRFRKQYMPRVKIAVSILRTVTKMKQLCWIPVMLFCLFSLNGEAQEGYDLMNWKTEYTVRTHLIQQMHDQYDLYMTRGDVLVLADLRGMGETMEREDANEWKYYNREYHNATISLHLGKPIVGQRVTDVFTLLDFLSENKNLKEWPVHIHASGAAGPVALYASFFREQVQSIQEVNTIQTYYDILNKPMELDWYSYVVPNVLACFDLPDLAAVRDDLNVMFRGEKMSNKESHQK